MNEKIKTFLPIIQKHDKLVFLSPYIMQEFQEWFKKLPLYNNKIYYIYNPLNDSPDWDVEQINNKNNTLLFVGRIAEDHKRLTYILKIWNLIYKKKPDWKLQIVGTGPDLKNIQDLASRLALKNIEFCGYQKPDSYYKKAKLFIMTSHHEGFGMTLLEAQQYGVVPVVMNSYSSLHDIILNEFNGIITPNNDIESFAKRLIELMNNEEKRIYMAKNGLETCKRFQVSKVVDNWELLFSELSNS